jgi:hypothetical protein
MSYCETTASPWLRRMSAMPPSIGGSAPAVDRQILERGSVSIWYCGVCIAIG